MIVPYSPGGTGDNIGRAVGAKVGELLGQQVIIDNRPGAGGNIGAEATVRAAPDGYTVVMAATSLASNPALQRRMPFDPLKDLVPVSGCCQRTPCCVIHATTVIDSCTAMRVKSGLSEGPPPTSSRSASNSSSG